MPRVVAFLRGINVGGHTVKMQDLRRVFESLGLSDVETVIASGNVVFEAPGRPSRTLEQKIETHLEQALGYEVATFLRTIPELRAVVAHQPFDLAAEPAEAVVHAYFLRSRPSAETEAALAALNTENDVARAGTREVYWLRRLRCKEAEKFALALGKALGRESSARNMNTVRRIADTYE